MKLQLARNPQISETSCSQAGKPRGVVAQVLSNFLRGCWQRVCGVNRRPARKLRLCESLGLGDRRFVAVVEFGQTRFLLGGTSSSLVLLAKLESAQQPSLPREDRN